MSSRQRGPATGCAPPAGLFTPRAVLPARPGSSHRPSSAEPPASRSLRYWLRPAAQQWWLDKKTRTAGEWVSLLVFSRQGRGATHRRKLAFASEQKAVEWLEKNGYLPAERAIEDGLVTDVPPDPTTQAPRRERVRASAPSQEPRMRVASDGSEREAHEAAEGATEDGDELDEDAARGHR